MATTHLTRRLHPAPLDYGIVEVQDDARGTHRFIIYRLGTEIGRCPTLDQAWRYAESHKRRLPPHALVAAPVSAAEIGGDVRAPGCSRARLGD